MQLPTIPSSNLSGRRSLVVGASSGIGLACAVALARAGSSVTCAARRTTHLDELTFALKKEHHEVTSCFLDIADVQGMAKTISRMPPFDIVVNAAGLARHEPALEVSTENYDAVMNINLKGAFFLSTLNAKAMIEHKIKGSIVHISSQMAHIGGQMRSVYCASKHGVEGMVKTFAIEWGKHNIRVNTVAPTFVYTDFTKKTLDNPELSKWVKSNIQLQRFAEVEDIAAAVLYLVGDMASMVTGTSLLVDGGWTAA